MATARDLPAAPAVVEALAPSDVVSLDQPRRTERCSATTSQATTARSRPERAVSARSDACCASLLQRLRPRKQAIVKRHYGIDGTPETLVEIASDLHLSPERTRALKDEALRELAADLTAPPAPDGAAP